MKVETLSQAKELIGKQLFWEEPSNRYVFNRTGILTGVYRKQLMFDDSQDYKPISDFKNLRTEF